MTAGAGSRVRLVPRHRTALASWSLVEAELAGLRMALEHSAAEHLIVLSGSCYPLVSVAELEDDLAQWRGVPRLRLFPLPHPLWNTPSNEDGGLWRFRRRFVSLRGKVVFVGDVPLRTFRRSIPPELRLYRSSQWKIYACGHAETLLRILGERRDLLRFWRTTLVPDEACVAFLGQHPAWLGERDCATLLAARRAPGRPPDRRAIDAADRDTCRKLFARKLSSRDGRLLDRIDQELRT